MKIFKKTLNNFAGSFFEKVGYIINPLVLKFKNENKQLLVFYFHGLFESLEQKDLNHIDPQNNMTTSQFEEFIEYFLNNNYTFIQPKDIKRLRNDKPYAMITFDDGYYNNILAMDILNKYKIPGVFFISTKNIIENKSYWWDIIYKYRIRQGMSAEKIGLEQESLKKYKHSFIDDYILKNFGKEAFIPWSDIDRPFNKSEIKKLAKSPYVLFGNHTHNHSILINCNKEEIKKELSTSRKIIHELTDSLINCIAFPNGNYNQIVLEAVKEEGFQYAFTTNPGKNIFPIGNHKLNCLNRYMTNTTKINKYGGFCRMGYEPQVLFEDLKMKAIRLLKSK